MHIVLSLTGALGIARKDRRPWPPLPREKSWWNRVTMERAVIVGRRTWQTDLHASPLAGRRVVVVSSTLRHEDIPTGVSLARSFFDARRIAKETCADPILCGGKDLFQQGFPFCTRAFVCRVHGEDRADLFFPAADDLIASPWQKVAEDRRESDAANPRAVTFEEYRLVVRIPPPRGGA